MGLRGELFSTRVILQKRTYFFNVKENRLGDLYLNIVESTNKEEGGFNRQSVILFADDLQEFLKGFDESLKILEKEVRTRKFAPHDKTPKRTLTRETPEETEKREKIKERKKQQESIRNEVEKRRGKEFNSGAKRESSGKNRRDRPPKDGKRVVVRKK